MRFFCALIILSLTICAPCNISAETKDIIVKPNEIVIETEGLVCAYCAYGLEKKLKKLPFVDPGNKGILVDTKNQLIAISILPQKKVDLGEIYSTIKSSGYDIIRMHFSLSGNIEDKDGKLLLAGSKYYDAFKLEGEMSKELKRDKAVDIKVHINKDEIVSMDKLKPIIVIVDSINYPEKTL